MWLKLYLRQFSSAISSRARGGTGHRPRAKGARGRQAVVRVFVEVGRVLGWEVALCFASARLLALLAWCCLLLICLPALRCAALLLGFFLLQRGTPFGSCLCRPGATALPLGLGGKGGLFLLVG